MKANSNTTEEVLKIPSDMAVDTFFIIVKEELKHEVIEVNINRSLLMVAVFVDKSDQRQQKAFANIQSLLVDYHHYRSADVEEIKWKED